jgi:hypothetical protein
VDIGKTASKLRPLAHVTLRDQVAATAIMLCLADRVETAQGDPRSPLVAVEDRQRVISYGNRLFCDSDGKLLQHRWGSNWEWSASDVQEAELYAWQTALSEFSAIALPQGLVSAGFFANIALLDFDDALRRSFDQELVSGVRLLDACRYVDESQAGHLG